MKQTWYNPIGLHKPAIHNALNHILSALPEELRHVLINSKIYFKYDDRPLPIKTPKANLMTHEIQLQDTHMAFLWCCSYATVAYNTMYYNEAMSTNENIIRFDNQADFPKVKLLMDWARYLKTKVTLWPDEAPRPDKTDKWTESAGNLYQACVIYLLLHEIAHIIKHQNLVVLLQACENPFYEMTPEERKMIYNAEVEADQFALESLMNHPSPEIVRMAKYLGAVLAHLSNFYLLDTADTRGSTHPDLDDRLRSVLKQADLEHEADRMQLRAHSCNGIQLFLILTGKPFIPDDHSKANFRDFEELEDFLFGLISEMKNIARERR